MRRIITQNEVVFQWLRTYISEYTAVQLEIIGQDS